MHRKIGRKRIEVGTDVFNYRFYPPDCVVWQTGRAVFGACGDRRSFPVARSLSLDWEFLDDRINYLGLFAVKGGRKPPERPAFILIDAVRAVASRQPELNESHNPTRDFEGEVDPALVPMQGVKLIRPRFGDELA